MDLDNFDTAFLLGQALNLLDVGHSGQFSSLLVGELETILEMFYMHFLTTIRLGLEVIRTPTFRSQNLNLYLWKLWLSLVSSNSHNLDYVYQHSQEGFVNWISNEVKFYPSVEKLRQWAVGSYYTTELLDIFGRNASSIVYQSFCIFVVHK